MKLIVLLVVSIAVFKASCSEVPDGRGITDDHHILFDEPDLPHGNSDSTIEPEPFTDGPANVIFSTDVDMDIPSADVGPGNVLDELKNHVDSLVVDSRLNEGERVQHGTELRGKKGGSKCKSDIVCSLLGGSCVTNSTYCSGREVPSVCSGTTCKCCIPVTLEVKVHDLETELRTMVVNLTVANLNQRTEMDKMMNSLVKNLNTVMNALVSNLTISNSDLKNELQVIKENLTIANSNVKNELQVMDSKLDSVKERQGCPEGLFYFAPSSQCFLMLNDTYRNWDQSNAACRAKGLVLAHPYDPLAIRSYIVTKYGGDLQYTWIGARGTGSNVKFQRSSRTISSYSPLWYSRSTSSSYCVAIATTEYMMKTYGDKLYYSLSCSNTRWALCELLTE